MKRYTVLMALLALAAFSGAALAQPKLTPSQATALQASLNMEHERYEGVKSSLDKLEQSGARNCCQQQRALAEQSHQTILRNIARKYSLTEQEVADYYKNQNYLGTHGHLRAGAEGAAKNLKDPGNNTRQGLVPPQSLRPEPTKLGNREFSPEKGHQGYVHNAPGSSVNGGKQTSTGTAARNNGGVYSTQPHHGGYVHVAPGGAQPRGGQGSSSAPRTPHGGYVHAQPGRVFPGRPVAR